MLAQAWPWTACPWSLLRWPGARSGGCSHWAPTRTCLSALPTLLGPWSRPLGTLSWGLILSLLLLWRLPQAFGCLLPGLGAPPRPCLDLAFWARGPSLFVDWVF